MSEPVNHPELDEVEAAYQAAYAQAQQEMPDARTAKRTKLAQAYQADTQDTAFGAVIALCTFLKEAVDEKKPFEDALQYVVEAATINLEAIALARETILHEHLRKQEAESESTSEQN